MERDLGQYRLLMIEDNSGDAALVEEYLQEYIAQPELTWVSTLQEANHHMLKGECFDAILLDLTLPDCSGKLLIDSVLALVEEEIPVIILTGHDDLGFAIQSMRLGVSDYLLKDNLDGALLYKTICYSIESKKQMLALQRSERRYIDLFQMSPQPAWCVDLQSSLFLEVNDAAIAHYGYSRAEFLKKKLQDLCPHHDHCMERTLPTLNDASANTPVFEGLYCHSKKNGKLMTVQLKSRLVHRQGQWVCLMLANDVTLQQEHIQNIEQQNRVFQEIVWTQSHEVRAPLARILGLVQLLQISDKACDSQQNSVLLNAIQLSSEELDQMIQLMVRKTEAVQTHFYQCPFFE